MNIFCAEIKNQLEKQLDCLDSRLDEQKDDLEDLQDFLKKRAEVERKYSKGSNMNIEGRL